MLEGDLDWLRQLNVTPLAKAGRDNFGVEKERVVSGFEQLIQLVIGGENDANGAIIS